jgi:hypothetical protein
MKALSSPKGEIALRVLENGERNYREKYEGKTTRRYFNEWRKRKRK